MHKFASPSPDSRELVCELEFVWDQVKSNVPSSSSSSPLQNKSPMSQTEEELEQHEAEIDRDEFVDAPDSQYHADQDEADADANAAADAAAAAAVQSSRTLARQRPMPVDTPTPASRVRSLLPQSIPILPHFTLTPAPPTAAPQPETAADKKWRGRVEQALQKMTAEVAALREQLEARRLFSHSPHYRLIRGIWRWVWAGLKHIAVDILLLGIVLLYMRRRQDRRLEGAIRVLLGDAVAQVQKVGGAQLGKVKLPGMGRKGAP
jgi:hypothetical protein